MATPSPTASPRPVYHVELGGRTRPVRFDFQALADFGDLTGLSLVQLEGGLDLTIRQLADLALFGLQGGARKRRELFEHTAEDVTAWLNDFDGPPLGDGAPLSAVLNAFMGSLGESTPAGDSEPSGDGADRTGHGPGAVGKANAVEATPGPSS